MVRRAGDASSWSVVWTRGEGCETLAGMLASDGPSFAEGDLRDACIAARAHVIVQRKLTSFDLVNVVASNRFDVDRVSSVVAAIGGDLAISLLTRDAGLKNSSSWLPGFGGVLDLLDSIVFAAPIAYLLWITGLVGP